MSVHTSHDDNDVLVDPRERAYGGGSQNNKHTCTNTVILKQVKISNLAKKSKYKTVGPLCVDVTTSLLLLFYVNSLIIIINIDTSLLASNLKYQRLCRSVLSTLNSTILFPPANKVAGR